MRHDLRRQVIHLAIDANFVLDQRAYLVWQKYSENPQLADYVTLEELEILDAYIRRHEDEIGEDLMKSWQAYGWVFANVLFRHKIYPLILRADPKDEDYFTVLGFDNLFVEL